MKSLAERVIDGLLDERLDIQKGYPRVGFIKGQLVAHLKHSNGHANVRAYVEGLVNGAVHALDREVEHGTGESDVARALSMNLPCVLENAVSSWLNDKHSTNSPKIDDGPRVTVTHRREGRAQMDEALTALQGPGIALDRIARAVEILSE